MCVGAAACVVFLYALNFVTRGVENAAKFLNQMGHDIFLTYVVKVDVTASAAKEIY